MRCRFLRRQLQCSGRSSQLCAPLLQLQPGLRVLDACSAPGGRTGHLLETCPDIELVAMDNSSRRLKTCNPISIAWVLAPSCLRKSAAAVDKWWNRQPFDRILLDAPCSGTGVIRRHPDIKVLRRPADIDSFCQQQR
ncbi:MAG: hypothetical protein ACFHHU_05615 [Porticoccaceae bacterium]